jgi:hypothetical protein
MFKGELQMIYATIPLLYSDIHPYAIIYVEIVLKLLYFSPLCLVTLLFYKIIMVLIILQKCLNTCCDISARIQYMNETFNCVGCPPIPYIVK